jgi:PAS domain S-box-containing protein
MPSRRPHDASRPEPETPAGQMSPARPPRRRKPSATPAGSPPDARHVDTATSSPSIQFAAQLLEVAPDAVVAVDPQGTIVLVNRQTERLFGYARDTLVGQSVDLLVPAALRGMHRQHRQSYALAPRTRAMGIGLALLGQRADGRQFPVEISLSPFETEDTSLVIATVRDMSERQRLEGVVQASLRAAEAQRHLLQAILDELPCGVYLARGPQARLVLANRAATALWGASWPAGQPLVAFLRKSGLRFLLPNGQAVPVEQLPSHQALRTGDAISQVQLRLARSDGTALPVLINALPVAAARFLGDASQEASQEAHLGATGEDDRMVLVVYDDVTQLEQAERLKDEFIAVAAHELRNPTAAATGYASMLLRNYQDSTTHHLAPQEFAEWQQEALEHITHAMTRLVVLTDDLLDATKVQAGRLELLREPHEVVALLRRVSRRVQGTTAQHTLVLVSPAEPLVVELDIRRIEQVISNLLSNAIKYSPAGGEITLTVRRTEAAAPSQGEPGVPLAEIAIADQGIGIPTADHSLVFGRFARARNARALGVDGTGLGLYLCRELVERHGGTIRFASTEGAGTTVTFTLPLLRLEDEDSEM